MNLFAGFLLFFAVLAAPRIGSAQDAEGCKDSPLVGRYPGSVITECTDKDDDKFEFTLDKGKKDVEGTFHQVVYQFPKTASKAQVVRNLNTALRRAGYTSKPL